MVSTSVLRFPSTSRDWVARFKYSDNKIFFSTTYSKPCFLKPESMFKTTRLKVLLFVLLPKVARESDKQGGAERTHDSSHFKPEINHLTRLGPLCWQRYSSSTEPWLRPHIHRVLKRKAFQRLQNTLLHILSSSVSSNSFWETDGSGRRLKINKSDLEG